MILRRQAWLSDLLAATVAAAVLSFAHSAHAATCANGPNGVMFVTPHCVDPEYNNQTLVIDGVTQESSPQSHTRVKAHFPATKTKPRFDVILALPPKEKFQGRFFQHTYPLPQGDATNPTNFREQDITFAFASGGYYLKQIGDPRGLAGYRPGAAAAKWARGYAADFYGYRGPIYGYLFGGSGGSFQTIGAVENTKGVWHGAVPYVMGTEASFVSSGSIVALVALALKDKLPAIADAVRPGGSGNPFAGLTPDEAAILREAQHLGVPLHVLSEPIQTFMLSQLAGGVKAGDPTYVKDFWTKPGYEGANPPPYLAAAKFDKTYTVTGTTPQGGLILNAAPDFATASTTGAAGIEYWVYDAAGNRLPGTLSGRLEGNILAPGRSDLMRGRFTPGEVPENAPLIKALRNGGKLRVNNLWQLALTFYHRHTIPKDPSFYPHAQFRRADGSPIYPQRAFSYGNSSARNTAGGALYSGRLNTKVILVSNLYDNLGYPWQADWYSNKVRAAMGQKSWADNLRVQFTDHADHIDNFVVNSNRIVNYNPMLYQSLRDLVGWVEKGVQPPASTRYRMVDVAQVQVPATAAARGGIQPVVQLTANGADRVTVAPGQPVTLSAKAEAPPRMGKIVKVEWYSGEGPVAYEEAPVAPAPSVRQEKTFSYSQSGTYYPAVRATLQREGKPDDVVLIQNLDAMRVIVR